MAKQKMMVELSGKAGELKLSEVTNYRDLTFMSWKENPKTGEVIQDDKGRYSANILSIENEATISLKVRNNPMQMNLKKGDSVDLVGNISIVPWGQQSGERTNIELSVTGDRLEKKVNEMPKQEGK